MSEVVINNCYGGYSLSYKAVKWLSEHGLEEATKEISLMKSYIEKDNSRTDSLAEWRREHKRSIESESFYLDIPRHHPLLIQCVRELGEEAGGMCAELVIASFEGNLCRIDEYDGLESIETPDNLSWINSSEY